MKYGISHSRYPAQSDSTLAQNSVSYNPRVLIFDHKSNFGTFAKSNTLSSAYEDCGFSASEGSSLWQGAVEEHKGEPIAQSDYHAHLENDDDELDEESPPYQSGARVRYWADFSRLYFAPHSLQAVPDGHASARSTDGNWGAARDVFARFNEETDVMDASVRVLFEECDNPQGLQVSTDVRRFGGFTHALVVALRDEYPKLPVLDFALLSDAVPPGVDVDDPAGISRALNDAIYLREMKEVASGIIPIQALTALEGSMGLGCSADLSQIYHSSAIISAHAESVTLPLRQRNLNTDLASLIAGLNWRSHTAFAQLGGVLPVSATEDWALGVYNFSIGDQENRVKADTYARVDIVRGFSEASLSVYESWSSRRTLPQIVVNSFRATGYPLPSSFPAIFDPHLVEKPAIADIHSVSSTPSFSSLTTSSAMARIFSRYAAFVERLRKRPSAAAAIDFLDVDDWRELANDLWTLHDNYGGELDDGESDEFGEDEL